MRGACLPARLQRIRWEVRGGPLGMRRSGDDGDSYGAMRLTAALPDGMRRGGVGPSVVA